MILNFFMWMLKIVILVASTLVSLLALVLMVSAFRAGLWIISVLITGFLAVLWWVVLSTINEGEVRCGARTARSLTTARIPPSSAADATAKELGVSHEHLHKVVTGRRQSRRLAAELKKRGIKCRKGVVVSD